MAKVSLSGKLGKRGSRLGLFNVLHYDRSSGRARGCTGLMGSCKPCVAQERGSARIFHPANFLVRTARAHPHTRFPQHQRVIVHLAAGCVEDSRAAIHVRAVELVHVLWEVDALGQEEDAELAAPRRRAHGSGPRDTRRAVDGRRRRKSEARGAAHDLRALGLASVHAVAVVRVHFEREAAHAPQRRTAGALDDAEIHPLRVDLDQLDRKRWVHPPQDGAQREARHCTAIAHLPAPLEPVGGHVERQRRGAARIAPYVEVQHGALRTQAVADGERQDDPAGVVLPELLKRVELI